MDDFTEQTAIGYYLFAFHLWGENDIRACHYRDITRSLCKRIEQTGRNINKTVMFMLELGTLSIGELSGFPCRNSLQFEKTLSRFEGVMGQESQKTFSILHLVSKLLKTVFICNDNSNAEFSDVTEDPMNVPFQDVDPKECDTMLPIIDQVYTLIRETEILGDERYAHAEIFAFMHKASLFFATKKFPFALSSVRQLVELLETNGLQSFYSPQFISVCHLLFFISVTLKDYTLANRITGLQRKLATKLPVALPTLTMEMDLLRAANDTIETHNNLLSSKPQEFSPEITSSSFTSSPHQSNAESPDYLNSMTEIVNNIDFTFASPEENKPQVEGLLPWEELLEPPSNNSMMTSDFFVPPNILTASQENLLLSTEDVFFSNYF